MRPTAACLVCQLLRNEHESCHARPHSAVAKPAVEGENSMTAYYSCGSHWI
eukprot:jgi/Botrbrau1/16804/Bobra.150_2s0031.1